MRLPLAKLLVPVLVALAAACGGSSEVVSLLVVRTGTAEGSVSSSPAGIDCGATCTATFPPGTGVVLTAAPAPGAAFTGWSGACSGAALTCALVPSADTAVAATFDVARHQVSVVLAGNGAGMVASTPLGISCPGVCAAPFDHGTALTLDATPQAGSIFLGWSGACTGTGPCAVTLTAAATVTAAFGLEQSLVVTRSGTGSGTVTGGGGLIDCGATCSDLFPPGASVTLTATPATGSTFAGWTGGGCSGTGTCTVVMDVATTVDAAFTLDRHPVEVTWAGNGMGTVSSVPAGIDCGATCSAAYDYGTTVTLTAAPATGSTFTGWSGACTGTGACAVAVTAPVAVTATFTLDRYPVAVARTGSGTGNVTSAPAGISCGATCSAAYDHGTTVTLTAAPATGSTFTGWTGGCTGTGTGTCTVAVTGPVAVTATFTLDQFAVTVTRAGNGAGTVTSAPAGISCGATCSAIYDHGTTVTLTAAPAAGSTFTGWSGACTGTASCTLPVTAAVAATATFTLNQYPLTVSRAGAGSGTVTSTPAGINCGATCSAAWDHGTTVTLTAAPGAGSTLSSWVGCDSVAGATCSVSMTSARTVTATFSVIQYPLTVARAGTGSGTVTSTPAGISCGATCTAGYDGGTTVTLTAVPSGTSTFNGWSGGGCSGTGTCTVLMTSALTVTATFTATQYTLTVSKAGIGSGTVTSAPAGISCGTTCAANYAAGSTVTLTAVPDASSTFTGWSGGGCSGTGICTVSMTGSVGVVATFNRLQFTLTVTRTGIGGAISSVTSSPAGISCGGACSATYDSGTNVVLVATPGAGATFTGWSGACSGTGTCAISMTSAKSVTATFD